MTAARYPKPAILEEIPRDRHAVIEASAGTGKTYALEHLLVELLLTEPVSIEQILVVTFTDRATHELRMRVRALLARLRAPDRNEAAPGEPAWTLDEAAREKLDAALRQFDLAPIATIHAFCRGVLTENAFNGGRLFEQELVDGRRLFAEVLRRTIRTVLACREPFRTLLRWWAACHGMDALTAGLYQAVRADVRILDADGAERYIAAVEAAAAVLCGAVGVDRLRGGLGEVTSKGKRLGKNSRDALERHLAALGEVVRRAAEPVDLFRDRRSLARPLEYLAEKRRAFDFGGLAPDLDAILSGIATLDRLKAVALAAFRDEAARAFARDKERRGLYDFGDMLALVHEALRGENGPALAAALRRRYRFALIDEFQDTDRVQWDIFRRIFFEDGGRHRLYTVGDPKQAIYAFRGADVRAYLRAREAIVGAGGARLALTRNYRSTAAMIAAVNALLLRDGQDAFFTGRHIGYDRPVECGRPALRAVAADGAAVRPLCLLRVEPGAGRGAERLGRAVAAAIRDLVDRRALCVGEREDALAAVGYGDIFVMTRTNRECDRMGEFLRAAGVPFAFYRKEGLFQTDEARDIRDLLRAIAEPADRSRLGRAWVTPFFGVPLGEVARFQELEPDHPFARRLLAWRDAARRRDFETLFVRILDESGVLRRELFVRENERKLTNYLHICELLLEECGRRGRELAGVIGALESYIRGEAEPPGDESTQQRLETDRLSVQVMTMHKAKGLEAPVVFLYGGYGASPPGDLHVFHRDDDLDAPRVMAVEPLDEGARERWQRDEREEEERLLYVAITRAAARLYLPWIADRALRSFVGGYRILNDRLNAFAEDEANAVHFERITVPALEAGAAEMAAEAPVPVAWMPPPEVLEEARPAALDFAALARAHAAIVVSSYSRMKRAARGERTAAPEIAAEAGGKEVLEDEPTSAPDAEAEDVLPGGTATGSFLHEVLERVDLAPVRGSTLADWSARPEVEALFRAAMARHDRDPRHLPHARRLVHTALTADLALGDARLAGGIAALDPARVRREMEFLYPIPEAGHPRLGAPLPAAGFTVERGYLRGFVDLVFEHDGRVYFADWKTDLLPEYTASTLAEHVERNYDLQVKVYAVAMARWLGLGGADNAGRRFGGILYCFVRGMEAPGSGAEGVHFRRPDRAELEGYARELREFAHYRETHHGA